MILAEMTSRYQLLLIGCFVWVPVIAMIFFFINAMIMAEIEVTTGLLGMAFAGALGFFGFRPPDPAFTPFIFLVSVVSLAALPLMRWTMNRVDLSRLQLENVESAYEALVQKSNNIGAQIKLAKAIHTRGMRAHGVAMADKALTGMDQAMFSDDIRMVRQWRQHVLPEEYRPLACLGCGQQNQPGTFFCAACGKPYLLDYARGWSSGGLVQKIAAAWIGAVAVGLGIPIASKTLPPGPALAAIPILILVAGLLLWRAFRASARTLT